MELDTGGPENFIFCLNCYFLRNIEQLKNSYRLSPTKPREILCRISDKSDSKYRKSDIFTDSLYLKSITCLLS